MSPFAANSVCAVSELSDVTTGYTLRKAPFCSLLLAARQVKWRGELNLKAGEKSWHTVLCCRRPNKVSCRNHSSTPGISMHAFPKEAKRKQKWMTFTRIHMHRLACERNTLPCAPSILEHCVSAEMCLLGHQ